MLRGLLLHKTFNKIFLVAGIVFLSYTLPAQKADFQFYTTQDGLSGNVTSSIIQDSKGFLWLYNNFQLHRFDGLTFEPFFPPSELAGSGDKVSFGVLFQDSILLSLGYKYLLSLNIESGTWRSYALPLVENKIYHFNVITCQDEIFISGQSENSDSLKVWKFQDERFSPAPSWKFGTGNLQMVTFDAYVNIYFYNGRLGTGKRNAVRMWNRKDETLTTTHIKELPKGATIVNIDFLDDGSLSLLTHNLIKNKSEPNFHRFEVFTYRPKTKELIPHPINHKIEKGDLHLTNQLILPNGNMWLVGAHRQVLFYNAIKDTLINFTPHLLNIIPNRVDINTPRIDQNGSVWFGNQLGLLKATLLETKIDRYFFTQIQNCLGHCSFRGISGDDQGNMFASYYHGLVHFRPLGNLKHTFYNNSISPVPLPSGIRSFQEKLLLNNGDLFDFNLGGIRRIEGSKNGQHEGEGLFTAGKDGRIWWAHFNDLFYLEEESGSFSWQKVLTFPQIEKFPNEAIHSGKYSELLYIGREGKLFQYEPMSQAEKWFDLQNLNKTKPRVLAIEEDKKKNLWLATDVGLIYFNPQSRKSKIYTQKDGLPNDFICGMLTEGDSSLWLSTNHGLSRFSIASETFINFFEEDGLTHNEFNRKSYYKADDGRMYFGGLSGINAFYPQELLNSFYQQYEHTKLSLSAFEYIDEKEGLTKRQLSFSQDPYIHIYYHHRSFSFEYALTDYRNPAEVQYSYRMKGYQDTWSAPSKFNFTRFSSLPSGEYDFQVRAKDSHGRWHPNQLSVSVIVHPPWWATWWAYFVYLLLIAGIVYMVFRFLSKRWELQMKLKQEREEALRLKNLDSFKSKLYTNITHEFRTPLTVILGMTEQIRSQPEKFLEKGTDLIQANGKNLLRLINQLLDLSKLEDRSFRLQLEHGDIISFVRYITESFQTFANGQNLSLRFHSTLEELAMDFDPEQIKQIMTNLISNAIKFTPSGGEIQVQLKAQDDLPAMAKIVVKDSGIGIDKDELPNIFDRFYQVDGSITRKGEGTGIGLAHTLELVKLMGGSLDVQSELGKGSSFTILLPIRESAPYNPQIVEGGKASQTRPIDVLNGANHRPLLVTQPSPITKSPAAYSILIIEDNSDVVDYLKACLEESYQLDIAFNGRIGIEKAMEQIPDLILSDVMMPEKDGFVVCDTLKNDERTSHIPIILLTAKADAASKIAGLRRGADAYLSKPFDKEELLVRVEQLLARQGHFAAHFSKQTYSQSPISINHLQEAIQIEDSFIQKVRQIIEENYMDEDFGLPELSRKIGMSRSQLYRKMKALVDIPPSDFIRNYRLDQARLLLTTTKLTVSEVAWKVGFKDLSHFSKAFHTFFGELPSATNK